jgi:hypothetical protein
MIRGISYPPAGHIISTSAFHDRSLDAQHFLCLSRYLLSSAACCYDDYFMTIELFPS